MQIGKIMSFETPVIVLLLLGNFLWFFMGYVKGFKEGKREGLVVGKTSQRVASNAR